MPEFVPTEIQPPIIEHIQAMVRVAPKAMNLIAYGLVPLGDLEYYYTDSEADPPGQPCGCLVGAEAIAIEQAYPETRGVLADDGTSFGEDGADDLVGLLLKLDPLTRLSDVYSYYAISAIASGVAWEVRRVVRSSGVLLPRAQEIIKEALLLEIQMALPLLV